jgi:hypothetical protein
VISWVFGSDREDKQPIDLLNSGGESFWETASWKPMKRWEDDVKMRITEIDSNEGR